MCIMPQALTVCSVVSHAHSMGYMYMIMNFLVAYWMVYIYTMVKPDIEPEIT